MSVSEKTTSSDERTEAPAGNPKGALVTTEWVAEHYQDPALRILEVSVEPGVFEGGHIPNAQNIVWHSDLVDPVNRDIVSKENFEKLLSRLGVGPDTEVLLYGDHNNWFAAWGVWMFHYYGHRNVRLIDGGRVKWEKEKRPLVTETPTVTPTHYKAKEENKHLRAFLPDVIGAAKKQNNFALVDIRSPDEYQGKIIAPPGVQELAIRAGHVPGAVNVPWSSAVNQETGAFKSVGELRKLYKDNGIDGSRPVITYCRIGERSSHTWFVLTQILGYKVANYDGSWTEYGNAVGTPIENPSGSVWTGK